MDKKFPITVRSIDDIPGYGQEDWVTISQYSKVSGISLYTLHRWVRTGKIEGYKFLNNTFINTVDIPTFKKKNKYKEYFWKKK